MLEFVTTQGDVRQRVVDAAADLFSRDGIRAIGVDALIAYADVARATFYRYFRSKDDLVVAWLLSDRARWFDAVRCETERRASSASAQLVEFFDVLAELLVTPGFRGCPYLNTAAEFPAPSPALQDAVTSYVDEVAEYLGALATSAGYRDPQALGRSLWLVVAGEMALAAATHDPSIGATGADSARRLLSADVGRQIGLSII
jgi:AcrR family transcriptional regulator